MSIVLATRLVKKRIVVLLLFPGAYCQYIGRGATIKLIFLNNNLANLVTIYIMCFNIYMCIYTAYHV